MADMRSAKDGETWKMLRKRFPRVYKAKLDVKEVLQLIELVYDMRRSTPPIWRDAKLKDVVNEYLDQLETLRNIGQR